MSCAASDGAITRKQEEALSTALPVKEEVATDAKTWDEASELYRANRKRRFRMNSNQDADSRINIAGRIFETRRLNQGKAPGALLKECATYEAMEYLQNQLLEGAEGRYDSRSPNTVNSMFGAIMAFIRYCHDHDWIDRVPPIKKLEVDEVMRGRPITQEEFQRMVDVTALVVGAEAAESWKLVLHVLWESGFRIGELLDFSWDNATKIHPKWSTTEAQHHTIVVPSTQKNRKVEEIPLLPGLWTLLKRIPDTDRTGFVVNPLPVEYVVGCKANAFKPKRDDLEELIEKYSNRSIGKACGVSDQTVRSWILGYGLSRSQKVSRYGEELEQVLIDAIRKRSRKKSWKHVKGRLSSERVSEVISAIGKEANIVVRSADDATGQRVKYASAHDLRRSLAERLINQGVSAETLTVVMRHKDFATTRKHYGARRGAQAAAEEVHNSQGLGDDNS